MSVLNQDGSVVFDLQELGSVFDVVYIGHNSVALTSLGGKFVIIDIQNKKVKKTLNVDSTYNGATFNDGKLIYCAKDKGLKMISLSDAALTSITTRKMSSEGYVATHGAKLFFTNEDNLNVSCCDFHGNIMWMFKDIDALSYPFGISVDNDGNVYVSGVYFHNFIVISADGSRYRELLSSKDGLYYPTAVVYHRSNNKILVANNNDGNAFVYDVV